MCLCDSGWRYNQLRVTSAVSSRSNPSNLPVWLGACDGNEVRASNQQTRPDLSGRGSTVTGTEERCSRPCQSVNSTERGKLTQPWHGVEKTEESRTWRSRGALKWCLTSSQGWNAPKLLSLSISLSFSRPVDQDVMQLQYVAFCVRKHSPAPLKIGKSIAFTPLHRAAALSSCLDNQQWTGSCISESGKMERVRSAADRVNLWRSDTGNTWRMCLESAVSFYDHSPSRRALYCCSSINGMYTCRRWALIYISLQLWVNYESIIL